MPMPNAREHRGDDDTQLADASALLADQVRRHWIDGVLNNAIRTSERLDTRYRMRADLVANPFADLINRDADSAADPASGLERAANPRAIQTTDPAELFLNGGNQLLLLGEPGAGKTTALLRIAEALLLRHAQDISAPLPVVLHLAGWQARQPSLRGWISAELTARYRIPRHQAEALLDARRLVMLFDALDELPAELHEPCALALRQWVDGDPDIPFALTCRRAVYERLSTRVPVRTAASLLPLSEATVDKLWSTMGLDSEARRSLLMDPRLAGGARTPLMAKVAGGALLRRLTTAEETGEEIGTRAPWTESQAATSSATDPECGPRARSAASAEVPDNLFGAYITELFARCPPARSDTRPRETLPLLARIGERMVSDGAAQFEIESIDDRWLPQAWQRRTYALLFGALLGLVASPGAAIFWGVLTPVLDVRDLGCRPPLQPDGSCLAMAELMPIWAWAMALWGLSLILLDSRLPITAAQEPPTRRAVGEVIPVALTYLACWMLLWVALLRIISDADPTGPAWMVPVWLTGLALSLLVAVWRSQRSALTAPVRSVEAVGWAWGRALLGASYGATAGVVLWVIHAAFAGVWILNSLPAYLIIGAAIGLLLGGLKPRLIDHKVRANEGIRLSVNNALLGATVGALTGAAAGAGTGLLVWQLYAGFLPAAEALTQPGVLEFMLRYGAADAVALSGITALWLGGAEAMKHGLLRMFLVLTGSLPVRLVDRLDSACEVGLLQRVGSGWMFSHRLLAEHLATHRKRYETAP